MLKPSPRNGHNYFSEMAQTILLNAPKYTYVTQSEFSTKEVARLIRNHIEEKGLYRINRGDDRGVDVGLMTEVWTTENLISIASWGIPVERILDSSQLEEGPITPDKVDGDVRDQSRGGSRLNFRSDSILAVLESNYEGWNKLRDEDKNPTQQAGFAAGSLNRFFNEMSKGTPFLGNLGNGMAFGRVVDEYPEYRPNGPTVSFRGEKVSDGHQFVREVEWARNEYGDVIQIPYSQLPNKLGPVPQTVTAVNDVTGLYEQANVIEFLAGHD